MSPRPEAPGRRSVAEVHYRIEAPSLGLFPGHHRSPRGEGGFNFRGHASLLDLPDPRRLDLHASLRDPFGQWKVRVHSERRAVPVTLLADLSASMGFDGRRRKLDVLADFTDSLAQSAWRTGDSFGFIGCDERVRPDFHQPQTRSRGPGVLIAERLRRLEPTGASAQGLLQAHRHLGRQRALVFVLSDFHWPLDAIDRLLADLALHEVVPVVLWDAAEASLGDRTGLAEVTDPETGRRRLLWWRPRLAARWQAAWNGRRDALLARFRRHRRKPLFIEGGFDADAVTRHFHA